ncbi:hypothetical protein SNE40_013324 [Patella caerulea]|uniref:Uncharacterized protein n=1 Tax=Patella caerulea TaxID=87958 RepID=A0AAN8JJD3_PATCE
MELAGNEKITIEKVQLKRSINFASTTSILLTNIGGSAIFISPSAILHYSGSPIVALILWLISGILNAGLAFCFVEIGLLFPKAGGPYFYILEVFGSLYGFIFLWGFVSLIFASSWAISSYSAAIYLVTAASPSCPYPDIAVKILAGWIIVTLVVLNCTYMKLVTKIQGILSMAKILALLLIIVTGLLQLSNPEKNNLATLTDIEDRSIDAGSLALGLFAGFFNYGGWQVITILMEEVQNPSKTLPKSVLLSFSIMICLYLLANFSYLLLLTPAQMFSSDAVAILAMQQVHPILGVVVSILVAFCSISVLNVLIMGQPRLLFAASRVGHMPELFHMISRKFLTPWPAITFCSIPAFLVLMYGNIIIFIDTISLFACIMVSAVLVALLYLRYKQPNIKRPFRVPIVLPILMLFIDILLLSMSIYKKPQELGTCLFILSLSLPVYLVTVVWKNKPQKFQDLMARITLFLKTLFILEKSAE